MAVAAAALLYGLAVNDQLDLNGDSPRFVMLAASLFAGQGYVGQFGLEDQLESQIPYGYPLLLLPPVALFGSHAYWSFKLISIACILASLVAAWFWLSRWLPEEEARSVVLMYAFLASVQMYAVQISTEAPFMAASFACLGVMESLTRARQHTILRWVLFCALLSFSFHLRIIGLALLLALCLAFFLRSRQALGFLAAFLGILACLPWLVRLVELGLGYSSEFAEATPGAGSFAYRFFYNIAADTAKALPDLFFFPFFVRILPGERLFLFKAGIGVVLLCLVAWGFRHRLADLTREAAGQLRRIPGRFSVSEIYLFVYLAICLSWTVHGERYLLPVVPLLAWLLLRGCGRFRRAAMVLLVVAGLVGCTINIVRVRLHIRPPEEAGFVDAVTWLRAHSNTSERVMSRYPTWVAAASNQRGVRWEATFDPEVHLHSLLGKRIRWLIVDHIRIGRTSGADYLAPLLQKHPEQFVLRFQSSQNPPVRVYEFLGL